MSGSLVVAALTSAAAVCFLVAVILAKYGMDGKRDTRSLENNSLKDHDVKEGDVFDDPRLDKLWNKVCEEDQHCWSCALLAAAAASRLWELQVPRGRWVERHCSGQSKTVMTVGGGELNITASHSSYLS